jgi:putative ABC transport system permease protein
VVIGVLVALGLVKGFVAIGPSDLPLLADAKIDLTVLGFAVSAALISVLLASLAPGFRAAQSASAPQLRHNPGRARGRDDRRIMKGLSVVQISLAMLLLTIGSLLIQNFRSLLSVDSGIQSEGVMTLQLELPMASTARYPNQVQRDEFFDVLLQRVQGLPTVVEAAIASAPPLEEEPSEFTLRLPEDAPDVSRPANVRIVSQNYFSLLHIPLVRGRNFNGADKREGPSVVIVSTEFARNAWGEQDPIGKRIVMAPGREAEVIGVAASVRTGGLDTDPGRTVYVSSTQGSYNFMTLLVRTTSNPTSLIPGIRESVKDLDVTLPLHHVRPLESLVAGSVATQRFQMLLVAAFSVLMLLLALVGTYGVTAYGVNERTNELGIRAALGASSMDIQRLVLSESIRLALLGISIGAGAALAISKTLSHLVSELSALNFWSFSVAGILLLAAMLFATLVPARRASNVNPMDALRAQ